LAALGGISHQSLAGFLSTGSAGGSVKYDLTDAITWIRLVDGSGQLRTIGRGDPHFDAVLAALGLFGIIVEVGFSTRKGVAEPLPGRYDVKMTSDVSRLEDWDVEPFEKGQLARFFRDNEYARVLWWPQPMVDNSRVCAAGKSDRLMGICVHPMAEPRHNSCPLVAAPLKSQRPCPCHLETKGDPPTGAVCRKPRSLTPR